MKTPYVFTSKGGKRFELIDRRDPRLFVILTVSGCYNAFGNDLLSPRHLQEYVDDVKAGAYDKRKPEYFKRDLSADYKYYIIDAQEPDNNEFGEVAL